MKKIFIMVALALALVSCQSIGEDKKMEKYFFENEGVRIYVGDDASTITQSLGEPNKISRAPSCAGGGEDIIYIYSGFRLLAYSEKGEETVCAVELTNDAVSTPEGIRLGDSAETVVKVYGVPSRRENDLIEYESGGVKLRFALSKGTVKLIKYLL